MSKSLASLLPRSTLGVLMFGVAKEAKVITIRSLRATPRALTFGRLLGEPDAVQMAFSAGVRQ
jgi:hypothetical protein